MNQQNQEKRFLLRLDQKLYERIQADADKQGRSVNAHIVNILSKSGTATSFEKRQIIGKVISGKDLSDSGLVMVSGIYYRYLMDDNGDVDNNGEYAIIEANGNILTLRKI